MLTYPKNRYLYNGKSERSGDTAPAGELQDQSIGGTNFGWYDYGARFYDPELGRWHSADPACEEDDQESWTQYHYVFNNPIKHTDPDGRFPFLANLVGAATEYAVQVGTNIVKSGGEISMKSFTNIDGRAIAYSAGAGAMGVGIANGFTKLGKLAAVASKSEALATVINRTANVAGDAAASIAGNVVQGKEVTVGGFVADVVGGAVSKKIETNVKISAQNSPAGKTLQNLADRAQRLASGSNARQSRVENAKAATTKVNNYGDTKGFTAGTAGGAVVSKGYEIYEKTKERK